MMQAEGFLRGLPQDGWVILNAAQSNLLDGVFDVFVVSPDHDDGPSWERNN